VQYCIILHNSCHDKKFSNFLGFGLWIKFVKGKNCVNFNQFSRTYCFFVFCRCSCCSSTQRFSYKTSARSNTSQKVSSYAALCKFPFGDWTQPNIKIYGIRLCFIWLNLRASITTTKNQRAQASRVVQQWLELVVLVRNVGLVGACFSSQNPHLIYNF